MKLPLSWIKFGLLFVLIVMFDMLCVGIAIMSNNAEVSRNCGVLLIVVNIVVIASVK